MTLLDEQKAYWDRHPIGAEIFDAELGSREFYDQYVEYYDEFYAESRRGMDYGKYAGKSVLEVGCGLGANAMHFAQAGANVTAIDLSDTSVRCAKQLFAYRGLAATIEQGNAEKLGYPDESFDMVCSLGVLMLVPNIELAVSEIHRVLKPGGEVMVMLYNRWSWYWLLTKLTGTNVESERGDPPLNRVHSRRDVEFLFGKFSSVSVSCERPPRKTRRRTGALAYLYNYGFVPLHGVLPGVLTKRFGWHLVARGTK